MCNDKSIAALRGAGFTLSWLAAAALAGCAVGPDFKRPDPPAAAAGADYTPQPVPPQTESAPVAGGASQRFAPGQEIPAQWWSLFKSEPLDQLIRASLERSPNIAAAQAALRVAKESYNAEAGTLLYPSVTGQLGATRERQSPITAGTPNGFTYNLFSASVGVNYTFDVFGASRRELEGLAATVDYQRFQVEATYLTLVSNVVVTAIQEASLRAQLQATHDVVDAQQKQLDVIDKQFNAGAIARSTVLTQRTQIAQTAATIPPLEKALAQTRHQLSVYAGRLPSESGLPEFTLDSLQLPEELPLSLPSSLVRQRPDIRANEALLHQASAQIGVATANLYPQITLSGSVSTASFTVGKMFSNSANAWSLAAGLTQPIFNGGSLQARRREAVAAYEQADAQYRSTVLTAFQNVADSLRAIDADAATLKVQAEAESLARESLGLSTQQYQLGAVSYLGLLDAQRTYQQTRIALVQAQAARYSDTAALFQSLGGGWWDRDALADAGPPAAAPAAPTN